MGLSEDFELVFTSGTSTRLFLDPDEILVLFPEASYVDALEWVAFYSQEASDLLALGPDDELPAIAVEYVRAAVACALSRIYDWSGGGREASFQLGDLSVTGPTNRTVATTRAGASNWCELAALLREELVGEGPKAGMRGVVRGSKWCNPMPPRRLRHVDS